MLSRGKQDDAAENHVDRRGYKGRPEEDEQVLYDVPRNSPATLVFKCVKDSSNVSNCFTCIPMPRNLAEVRSAPLRRSLETPVALFLKSEVSAASSVPAFPKQLDATNTYKAPEGLYKLQAPESKGTPGRQADASQPGKNQPILGLPRVPSSLCGAQCSL